MTTETVTVLRDSPGGRDAYGDPVASTTASTAVDGCLVAPSGSEEPGDRGSDGVITGWKVYAPPGTIVLPTDRVVVRGITCRVEGEVADWGEAPGGVVITVSRALG